MDMDYEQEQTVKQKYGFLPTSVWNVTKTSFWKERIRDTGDPQKTRRSGEAKYLPNLKYSEFNPNVAERIVKYWSEEGDLVVDPFGGRATRAIVSTEMGRNYEGYEIAPLTYQLTLNRLAYRDKNFPPDIFSGDSKGKYVLHLDDGCKMKQTKDDVADLIMTCPPYYDLEKYEEVENQLSNMDSYEEFLEKISECAQNIQRVLKSNKFCAWVCGDWRNNGYTLFHVDSINIFRKMGMILWDIVILENNSPFAAFQVGKCDKHNYTSKKHEYLLIFKKE
jgi:DNA modification methylase